jgi:hypothetical protein
VKEMPIKLQEKVYLLQELEGNGPTYNKKSVPAVQE